MKKLEDIECWEEECTGKQKYVLLSSAYLGQKEIAKIDKFLVFDTFISKEARIRPLY